MLLPIFADWSYTFEDSASGDKYATAEAFLADYREGIRQAICFPPGFKAPIPQHPKIPASVRATPCCRRQ